MLIRAAIFDFVQRAWVVGMKGVQFESTRQVIAEVQQHLDGWI